MSQRTPAKPIISKLIFLGLELSRFCILEKRLIATSLSLYFNDKAFLPTVRVLVPVARLCISRHWVFHSRKYGIFRHKYFLVFRTGPLGEALDFHGALTADVAALPSVRVVGVLELSAVTGELDIVANAIAEYFSDNTTAPTGVVLIPISGLSS